MIELIESTLRLSTPLLFAALGGLMCERVGVATICLEGVMLIAAWTAATVNFTEHSCFLAIVAGVAAGALAMGAHAFLTVTAKADAIISGVAINLIAGGLTPLFSKALFTSPTNTPSIPLEERLFEVPIPFLSHAISPLLIVAFLIPFALHFIFYRTGWGLRLLAAGDGPRALTTAGVSVVKTRWTSMLIGGAIVSLGGIYLAIAHAGQFTRGMTAGRGFIALTAVIFGKWKPIPTFIACLLFGFADAVQIQLQGTTIFGHEFPIQLVQALPYVVTLVVLAGFIGKARPPLAIVDGNC